MQRFPSNHHSQRRDFLRSGFLALGVTASVPVFLQRIAMNAMAQDPEGQATRYSNRILVALELSGGNDGLNTMVPFNDDAYHRARPKLGLRESQILKLNDQFGLHPACSGMEKIFKEGGMAVVHGCGYPHPNLSHFTAMEWWHTAAPHRNEAYGWLGRFADAHWQTPGDSLLVQIGSRQSRALTAARHSPLVFNDPNKFGRLGTEAQQRVFDSYAECSTDRGSTLDFVNQVEKTAATGASLVQHACSSYHTPVDYGSGNPLTLDLKKTAALIAANLPTRIFYLSHGGFDSHAGQAGLHSIRLVYLSDALRGFTEDLRRIGRAQDVVIMIFTEFGRRVQENASGGTDHGTATPMFVVGQPVRGGFYGTAPSLTDLDEGNLKVTTDFRSVYSTLLKEWMGFDGTASVLKGAYPSIPIIG